MVTTGSPFARQSWMASNTASIAAAVTFSSGRVVSQLGDPRVSTETLPSPAARRELFLTPHASPMHFRSMSAIA